MKKQTKNKMFYDEQKNKNKNVKNVLIKETCLQIVNKFTLSVCKFFLFHYYSYYLNKKKKKMKSLTLETQVTDSRADGWWSQALKEICIFSKILKLKSHE